MNTTFETSHNHYGPGIQRFCDPWNRNIEAASESISLDAYTDADLAKDLNAMTFAERQAMEEDIHGAGNVIEETPEFVTEKIEKMREALDHMNMKRRQAWERAVFLRPALNGDRNLHLTFLRARRYRPDDAATLMAAYYQTKRDLFGDDLLIHRITWNDVRTYWLF